MGDENKPAGKTPMEGRPRRGLQPHEPEDMPGGGGPPAGSESQGILRRFFDGPRLRNFPAKRKDKDLVLEEILRRLPQQEQYGEMELNRHMKEIFPDFATLRREMVDSGYMTREAGIYRLTEKGKTVRGTTAEPGTAAE
jgi:hypothetical protein